ncbi:MAG: DUF4279 domain-containing protein [Anaerolineales bacterium]|nr:DUF4279 domain-containing protein [Anaerolineales bacterium]
MKMGDISRAKVGIRILGDDLIPDEVTSLLQCQPIETRTKGDVCGSKEHPRIATTGSWHLHIDEDDASILEEKVNKILNQLTDDLSIWEQITDRFAADIFCGLFLEEFNEGFSLSPEIMEKLSDRNLKIDFDIYLP